MGRRERGFTLIELLIVVAIIGIIASIAVPGLLAARRSANQASAIASLRIVSSAQKVFATTCAFGGFASTLPQLGQPPIGGGIAFISPDLGSSVSATKSGYVVTMAAGTDGSPWSLDACNGVAGAQLSSTYYATAEPVAAGSSGTYYYWLGVAGTIYQDTAAIADTDGLSMAPGGTAIN